MGWQKQESEALYPELQWSRPVNRLHAGTMLLVGGNSHGFAKVSHAMQSVQAAGIGQIKTVMPDSLAKLIPADSHTLFAPSTTVGSFSKEAVQDIKGYSSWLSSLWLVGDFGKNSETSMLLVEVASSNLRLIMSDDAIDYFLQQPQLIIDRPDTLLLLTVQQLQKLAAKSGVAITTSMGLVRLVERIMEWTCNIQADIVLLDDPLILASRGDVVTAAMPQNPPLAALAVWWTQFPGRPIPALSSAIVM